MCPSVGPAFVLKHVPNDSKPPPSVTAVTSTVAKQDDASDVSLCTKWNIEQDPSKKGYYAISYDGYCMLPHPHSKCDSLKACSDNTTKHYIWKFIDCVNKVYAVYCTVTTEVENDKTETKNYAWAAVTPSDDDSKGARVRVTLEDIDFNLKDGPKEQHKFFFLNISEVVKLVSPSSGTSSNAQSASLGNVHSTQGDGGHTAKRAN